MYKILFIIQLTLLQTIAVAQSIMPSDGWGWLIDKGFRIIETNYSNDLIRFLKSENRH